MEMIDALFKPLANGSEDGIIRELLVGLLSNEQGTETNSDHNLQVSVEWNRLLPDKMYKLERQRRVQHVYFRTVCSNIMPVTDGVSESQQPSFQHRAGQIIKAYQHLGEVDVPKFNVIIAQKNHHIKLFQADGFSENVPRGQLLTQMSQFVKFEDLSETSSVQQSITSAGSVPAPELSRLHTNVRVPCFFPKVIHA